MLDFLRYWWRVLCQATISWKNFVWADIIRGLLLTLAAIAAGFFLQPYVVDRWPSLEASWEGAMGSILDFLIGCIPVLAIIGASFLVFLFLAPYQLHQKQVAEIARLTPPDLDLFFEAPMAGYGQKSIHYTPVTLTNRSKRNMNLYFFAHLDFLRGDGKPQRLDLEVEWDPQGLKEFTGERGAIGLDAEESTERQLVIFLPKPDEYGLREWDITKLPQNVYIQANDSVTGQRIAFEAMNGHPRGKVPYPIPPVAELLAPQASEATIPNQPGQTPSPESAP